MVSGEEKREERDEDKGREERGNREGREVKSKSESERERGRRGASSPMEGKSFSMKRGEEITKTEPVTVISTAKRESQDRGSDAMGRGSRCNEIARKDVMMGLDCHKMEASVGEIRNRLMTYKHCKIPKPRQPMKKK